MRRWMPWQYDVEKKLAERNQGVILWEADRTGRLAKEARLLESWHRQARIERWLGGRRGRLMAWVRVRSGRAWYPTEEAKTGLSKQ
jgi:hypothetical protein